MLCQGKPQNLYPSTSTAGEATPNLSVYLEGARPIKARQRKSGCCWPLLERRGSAEHWHLGGAWWEMFGGKIGSPFTLLFYVFNEMVDVMLQIVTTDSLFHINCLIDSN